MSSGRSGEPKEAFDSQLAVKGSTKIIGVDALGAREKHILAMILGRGLGLVAAGIVIGSGIAAAATRALSHLLFGITTRDPLSYLVAAVSLLAVGIVACYLPARRATRVEPIEALRFDG